MPEIGYSLSSEELGPADLVRYARRAEETGFTFALISDHYHPWIDRQGHSPFVWSVLGGIAQATDRLRVGTGVTCPTIRIHPAIVAQASATVASMMPGRFFLGVGSGENLNEHILGDAWPSADVRIEMLEEAIEAIRQLWQGGFQSYRGAYYYVENARVYDLPDELPAIVVAASGPSAAETAGRLGDGFVGTSPKAELIRAFEDAGGAGKPRYGQMMVCWAEDERQALQTIMEYWPIAGVKGELSQELPLPRHFEQAAQMVREDDLSSLPLGPDPDRHVEMINQYAEAGYDHVYIHQVGPDQEGFFRFYAEQVLPKLQ